MSLSPLILSEAHAALIEAPLHIGSTVFSADMMRFNNVPIPFVFNFLDSSNKHFSFGNNLGLSITLYIVLAMLLAVAMVLCALCYDMALVGKIFVSLGATTGEAGDIDEENKNNPLNNNSSTEESNSSGTDSDNANETNQRKTSNEKKISDSPTGLKKRNLNVNITHTKDEKKEQDSSKVTTSTDDSTDKENSKVFSIKSWKKPNEKNIPRSLTTGEDAKILQDLIKAHQADNFKAWTTIAITSIAHALAFYFIHFHPSWWSVLFLAGVCVRCFIMFHDACHNSFFTTTRMNRKLAYIMQPFSAANMNDWSTGHNHHHTVLGNSAETDLSMTVYVTEDEYKEYGLLHKILFRYIREPLVFTWLATMFVFWVNPLLKGPIQNGWIERWVLYACVTVVSGGLRTPMLVFLGQVIGGWIGFILFHLQHQCNTPYRVPESEHTMMDAGLRGSTLQKIPFPFSFFTLGIEFHHIHHASTRVPGYRLGECHRNGEKYFGKDWERAQLNVVGPVRMFKGFFHTMFEGNRRVSDGSEHPKFTTFDIYKSLGFVDSVSGLKWDK